MEVVAIATVSTRLFCLSVELRTKNSPSSTPASASAWWVALPLIPALLASLLHATVIRPLAVATTRHCLKLHDTSCSSTWLRVLNKTCLRVLHILLSEQTSLWLMYLMAPHLFDINVKLRVEVGTIRAVLHLLLESTARLLLQLVTGHRHRASAACTDEDEDEDEDEDAATSARQGGVREREEGPRRSARRRRPNVRVAGPEWDKR